MPVSRELAQTPAGREIAGLALSCVRVDAPMALVRAAHWRNSLAKLGVAAPFFVVHDLGLLATLPPGATVIGPRPFAPQLRGAPPLLTAWSDMLREVAASEMVEKARAWRLSDDLVSVLLLRVLGPLVARHLGGARRGPVPLLPLDPEVYRDVDPQLPGLYGTEARPELAFLEGLVADRLRLVLAVEQIDLDTLRLLGMFGQEAGATSALSMLDLLSVLESAQANDVVNFSLDLLPSVLETKKASGQQTYGVDGYAGLERRGSLDSLVLSELAYDDELFAKRFAEHEVAYYAREKSAAEERRLHYLVVDASASMRGMRSTFARGVALTLSKKLLLRGEEVYLRFFDARLYEPLHARPGRRGEAGLNVPYVLSFAGERGRNYAKVFAQLEGELARVARRERKSVVLYILTHAECHVPVATIDRLRRLARLYGIYLLPSAGELDLEYLSHLDTVQIVDETALTDRDARQKRALAIIDDAAGERRPSLPPTA